MKKILIGISILFMFLNNMLYAQEDRDISKKDTINLNSIVLPSLGERMNIAIKINDSIAWSSLASYNKYYNYKGRSKQALNIGIRIADAFVALHDKDKNNFGNMYAVIFNLSKSLGIWEIVEKQKDKLQL